MGDLESYLNLEDNTQGKVVLSLLDLLQHHSWDDITVTLICQQAGVSRKSFYKFFPCKEALIDYMEEVFMLAYNENDDKSDFFYYFHFWYNLREWVNVLVRNHLFTRIARVTDKNSEMLRPAAWGDGLAGDWDNRQMMFEFINAGLGRMVECWCQDGWRKTPREMAELATYIIKGQLHRTPFRSS